MFRFVFFSPFSPLRDRMKTFAVIRYFDLSKGKMGLIAKHRASVVGGQKARRGPQAGRLQPVRLFPPTTGPRQPEC